MREEKNKIITIFATLCLFFLLVLSKAFYLQVINRSALIEKANKQFMRISKIFPNRGNIYDRHGSPLAINVRTYTIVTIPKLVSNQEQTYKKLASIVPQLSYDKIMRRIKGRTNYTFLARKISLKKEQYESIVSLESDGIYIEAVPRRFYPNHELLSQSLGFVGVDNRGLGGVEAFFDKMLRGQERVAKYLQDAKGRPIKFETQVTDEKPVDLYLSIDKELQSFAEKTLKDAVEKYDGDKGGVAVMDVDTGELLAIANYPSFDPNEYWKFDPIKRKLAFISDPFEPGSTFKTFTVASALEHKIARPDTNYYCERGSYRVESHTITEAESKKKYEWLSVSEILQHSSNIGTTKIAFDLTFPKLKKSLQDFRIGQRTGIEVPGESRGIFTDKPNVRPLTLSNISFGQGVAVTGIQMLAAYAAIVNGGLYHTPTIIKGGNKEKEPVRVISEKNASEIVDMLVKTVEQGTATNARIKYFTMGGKTSTAQRVAPEGGYKGYVPGFIGFPFNVDNKFVVYAYVDNPKGSVYYGNSVAAPIFREVAQYLLYKNKDFNRVEVNDLSNLKNSNLGHVQSRSVIKRDFGKGIAPNLIGLDKKSVSKLLDKYTIKSSHSGIGVVVKQIPPPESKISQDDFIKVFYEPPQYD
jgi:cell division protein FtsI (penicillin-binding protein 3)